ncbi:hypothetical protein SDC9_193441 [bioreactor metagenome]|uniref:Uncharacterized protein n=1 Tax=bioreactor metagenome TaxID=1076179 RepID=A0A645I4R6_9ZZZZ
MELCGWVEETVDIILTNYITQKVKNAHLQETIIGEVILPVYGFNYSKHLKPLLDKILGAANAQKMMLRLALRDGRDCRLKAIFGSLSRARDRAAHTHWHGTPCFAAPSSIINDFKNMRPILRSMERIINNMSLREY